MTKLEIKHLKESLKILKKEFGEHKCSVYAFGCGQCQLGRFLVDFESLIEDYIGD